MATIGLSSGKSRFHQPLLPAKPPPVRPSGARSKVVFELMVAQRYSAEKRGKQHGYRFFPIKGLGPSSLRTLVAGGDVGPILWNQAFRLMGK